jgi:ABC-type amino acid transport substrate-binding protein
MNKSLVVFVVSFTLAIFVSSGLAGAGDSDTLRIGTSHWPFWRIVENNTPGGADLEIWSEMARRAGLNCEFEIQTHQEYLESLSAGTIDGAVSLLRSEEREKVMVFLEPPFRTKQKFSCYVRKGESGTLESYEDLQRLRIGTAWRATFNQLDQDEGIKKHFHPDIIEQFQRLQQGRIDVLVACEWHGDYFLRNWPDAGLIEKALYFQKEYHPIYQVMSKKSKNLDKRDLLEKALAGMMEDGTVKTIIDRYVPGWYESYRKPFSIVQLSASYDDPSVLSRQVEWIKENQIKKNIGFVIHGGDMVRDGTETEWRKADLVFSKLDGAIPYAVATGNHDVFPGRGVPRLRNTIQFDRFFPVQRRQNNPYYAGHLESGTENMAFEFEQDSTRMLLLVLEFGVRDTALDWAHEVMNQHSGWPTIVVTHAFTLGPDSRNNHSWRPKVLDPELKSREELWNSFIRKYPGIFLVLSGHYKGVRRESGPGDYGKTIHQVMFGFPQEDEINSGYLRLMTFYPEQGRILFETYSPLLDACKRDADNQFEIKSDLGKY